MARSAKKRSSAAASTTMMKDFGPRLQKLRQGANLSAAELSRMLDVDIMQVYRYEKGENLPSVETAVKLARILHVSADELLTGEKSGPVAVQPIKNVKLLEKFRLLEQLPKDQQDTAIEILAGVIAKYELEHLADRMRRTG
jgi:transcriptional regulator with XRE-family HTH domain